jgi:hypothetical protein
VPVSGRTEILAGEWAGGFESPGTGRSGSILFKLKAGTDSAWGDVVMVYGKAPFTMEPPEPRPGVPALPQSRPIGIAFVTCGESGEVTGRLEPYQDPETGERIETTFTGKLRSTDEFQGTFLTYYPSGRRITGEWSVRRRKPAD